MNSKEDKKEAKYKKKTEEDITTWVNAGKAYINIAGQVECVSLMTSEDYIIHCTFHKIKNLLYLDISHTSINGHFMFNSFKYDFSALREKKYLKAEVVH